MKSVVRRSIPLVIAAVALSACGSEESPPDADGAPSSPIAELLGWEVDSSPAEQRAQQLRLEETVSECMRTEGFEYTPVDYTAQFGNDGEDADLYNDPQAYGEKYAYGVVRNYEQWEEPYLLGESGDGGFQPEFEDPNSEYLNSLSSGEQEEYYRLLYGQQSFDEPAEYDESGEFVDESTIYVSPPLEEQGCFGKAQLEIYGDNPFFGDPEIQQRLDDFFTDMNDNPEIAAAEQDWAECMRKEVGSLDEIDGFELTGPDSMYQYVDSLKYIAQGKEVIPLDPVTGEPIGIDTSEMEFGYSSTQNEDGTGWAYIGEDRPIEPDDLEALRAREKELWKIDQACQKDLDFEGIRARIEERIVGELKAEFPELAGSSG